MTYREQNSIGSDENSEQTTRNEDLPIRRLLFRRPYLWLFWIHRYVWADDVFPIRICLPARDACRFGLLKELAGQTIPVSVTVGWMKASGRPERSDQPESIEFVPKRELERAQQENEKLRKEIDWLKRESERLRRELESALRASKRQAAPQSRGEAKSNPKRPGRKPAR